MKELSNVLINLRIWDFNLPQKNNCDDILVFFQQNYFQKLIPKIIPKNYSKKIIFKIY